MKTSAITAFTTIALALTLPTTFAAKYNAVCIFDELKCGGSIQLREYTPDTTNKCETGDCAALTAPSVTMFSALPTCADDHLTDTEKHLKGKPYVIVETYAGTGCTGDFSKAVAVVASGKCFPSRAGNMSYQVTLGTSDLSVKWMQYEGGNCSTNATTVNFLASEVDRKTCVKDTMKVLAVKPSAVGTGSTATTPSASTNGTSPSPSPKSGALAAVTTTLAADNHSAWSLFVSSPAEKGNASQSICQGRREHTPHHACLDANRQIFWTVSILVPVKVNAITSHTASAAFPTRGVSTQRANATGTTASSIPVDTPPSLLPSRHRGRRSVALSDADAWAVATAWLSPHLDNVDVVLVCDPNDGPVDGIVDQYAWIYLRGAVRTTHCAAAARLVAMTWQTLASCRGFGVHENPVFWRRVLSYLSTRNDPTDGILCGPLDGTDTANVTDAVRFFPRHNAVFPRIMVDACSMDRPTTRRDAVMNRLLMLRGAIPLDIDDATRATFERLIATVAVYRHVTRA